MTRKTAIFLCLFTATQAAAHPHVFVETQLRVEVTDGMITGVDVTWSYDDFFTLLILEDMGLDPDGDAVLSAAELEQLRGFDLVEWPPGFEGDLYMSVSETPILLGHPQPTEIAVTEGRIVASHRRTLPPTPVGQVVLRQYDPTYYVDYTLVGVDLAAPCRALVTPPDPEAADEAIAKALELPPENEFDMLELGIYTADIVQFTCDPAS
ncbi:DUF1007 family protein [Puniceibacterium sp. IMCC21224]|uniref:DUF1007 family protein n=1 Tax=Puniceibacterium sp. IMCC21224 TaxID=1618204 RepID=UPI00064DCBBC|nr:DUF1007 family protein [Puniceibacterium sp. IMCC21224]